MSLEHWDLRSVKAADDVIGHVGILIKLEKKENTEQPRSY